jgi:hypothetical protein
LALAIQFTLSFGHAHRHDIGSFGASLQIVHVDLASAVALPRAPAVPSIPRGLAFDYCEIFAVSSLAVQVALPHRLFQARAPPQAWPRALVAAATPNRLAAQLFAQRSTAIPVEIAVAETAPLRAAILDLDAADDAIW